MEKRLGGMGPAADVRTTGKVEPAVAEKVVLMEMIGWRSPDHPEVWSYRKAVEMTFLPRIVP